MPETWSFLSMPNLSLYMGHSGKAWPSVHGMLSMSVQETVAARKDWKIKDATFLWD